MQHFIPPHHYLVVLVQYLLQTLIEVRLQVLVGFHSMRVDEGLDLSVGIPLTAVDLIPTDMKILIREKCSHLLNKLVYKLVGPFLRRVHDCIGTAGFNFIRSWT